MASMSLSAAARRISTSGPRSSPHQPGSEQVAMIPAADRGRSVAEYHASPTGRPSSSSTRPAISSKAIIGRPAGEISSARPARSAFVCEAKASLTSSSPVEPVASGVVARA